jgi:2-polyprenyl-3-methyl-5-hydroxy-6-metoxy-1,4-benzoquinol methylase
MGKEINLLELYPKSKRPIDERAKLITEAHRDAAKKFDVEYFDGDRLSGYGGYNYHPRFWTDTVKFIRDHYGLKPDAKVLDIGCAKGFMMHDFKLLMPDLQIQGIDISQYAKDHAKEEVKDLIQVANAKDLPFEDNAFDLVIAINCLHNLPLDECKQAFREIQRVSKKDAFVMNDAWRNEAEKESMLKWNLTAQTYMSVEDWQDLFNDVGFTGDYYWFIAESA